MKTLLAFAFGTVIFLTTGVSLAQSGNMMNHLKVASVSLNLGESLASERHRYWRRAHWARSICIPRRAQSQAPHE